MSNTRRNFIKTTALALPLKAFADRYLTSPAIAKPMPPSLRKNSFKPIPQTLEDDVTLPSNYFWYPLISYGEKINSKGEKFGECCDFTHFQQGRDANHGYLWVNHEYIVPCLFHGKKIAATEKTKAEVELEMSAVGGSFLEITRDPKTKRWTVEKNSTEAFRIDANTPIPIVGPVGNKTVKGMLGNCAGGHTPWGTVLTCEENFDLFFLDKNPYYHLGWARYFDRPLEDYGYVVEVDRQTKSARKLSALGRFAHEGATTTIAPNKKVVVYMGDDTTFECFYKFISKGTYSGDQQKDKDLLLEGTLYVANFPAGKWEPLTLENPKLKSKYKSMKDLLLKTREAAKLAGGTPLSRPEDVEVHPTTKTVILSLTNNNDAGDVYGSLLAIEETNGDASSETFSHSVYLTGGPQSGFAMPDNLAFSPDQSLWMTSDIPGNNLGKGAYKNFPRNSLFRIEKDSAGHPITQHFMQAPFGAEITGPCFHPITSELFASIQHPGETSFVHMDGYQSTWPTKTKPLSTVIVVARK